MFGSATPATYYGALGTLKLDGAGNISSGTITVYSPNSPYPCANSVTGTYSIDSTAIGTATINLIPTTSGCKSTETWKLAIAAADGGAAIQMARSDSIGNGSANKQ
jgi:hypothetical protein